MKIFYFLLFVLVQSEYTVELSKKASIKLLEKLSINSKVPKGNIRIQFSDSTLNLNLDKESDIILNNKYQLHSIENGWYLYYNSFDIQTCKWSDSLKSVNHPNLSSASEPRQFWIKRDTNILIFVFKDEESYEFSDTCIFFYKRSNTIF